VEICSEKQVKAVTKKLKVPNKKGLHAAVANLICQTVGKHDAKVVIEKDGNCADASSILDILTLGAQVDTEVIIRAEGKDARKVIRELERLFKERFGEE